MPAVMLVVMLASTSASAAPDAAPPRVTSLPFLAVGGAPTDAAVRLTTAVRAQLKGREDYEYVSAWSAPGATPEGAPRDPKLGLAIQSARENIQGHEFKKAAEGLEAGLAHSAADAAELDFERMQEAHLWLAVAFFRDGQLKRARAVLLTLARLQPDYQLPAGNFPPEFRAELGRARVRIRHERKALLVVSAPHDTLVSVDGTALGVGTVRRALGIGPHFIQGERNGTRVGEVVKMPASGLKMTLHPKQGALTARNAPPMELERAVLDVKVGARLRALCKDTGAEQVLLGVLVVDAEGVVTVNGALYLAEEQSFYVLPRMTLTGGGGDLQGDASTWVGLAADLFHSSTAPSELPVDLGLSAAELRAQESAARSAAARSASNEHTGPAWNPSNTVSATASAPKGPGVPWWAWTVGGVVVAGGAAYGAVRLFDRPVTGTLTARW